MRARISVERIKPLSEVARKRLTALGYAGITTADQFRDAVLGLATGSSPAGTYRELIRRHRAGTAPSYDGVDATARAYTIDIRDGVKVARTGDMAFRRSGLLKIIQPMPPNIFRSVSPGSGARTSRTRSARCSSYATQRCYACG